MGQLSSYPSTSPKRNAPNCYVEDFYRWFLLVLDHRNIVKSGDGSLSRDYAIAPSFGQSATFNSPSSYRQTTASENQAEKDLFSFYGLINWLAFLLLSILCVPLYKLAFVVGKCR